MEGFRGEKFKVGRGRLSVKNRPHISLDGLTPNEAEQNLLLNREQLRHYTIKAAEERKRHNHNHQCKHCTD